MSIRHATAKWEGTLKEGSGQMHFSNYDGPFSFVSRFEEGEGTNPEELVGAAHAGCYSMFLSALLSGRDLNPDSINTTAAVQLGKDDTGPVITKIDLTCLVKVSGIDDSTFQEVALEAKAKCPISRLYAGTEINLTATLI
jgi:osmotically inducible protein OsmC